MELKAKRYFFAVAREENRQSAFERFFPAVL